MRKCSVCSNLIGDTYSFCWRCGTPLEVWTPPRTRTVNNPEKQTKEEVKQQPVTNIEQQQVKVDTPSNIPLAKEQAGLNKKKRIVLITSTIVIALMLLFPPWKSKFDAHIGYGFLFMSSYRWELRYDSSGFGIVTHENSIPVEIDASRLMIQLLLVGVLAGGIISLSKRNN